MNKKGGPKSFASTKQRWTGKVGEVKSSCNHNLKTKTTNRKGRNCCNKCEDEDDKQGGG
jgi:hypothetical protein